MRILSVILLMIASVVSAADKVAILDAKPQYERDAKIILRVKGADGEIVRIKWWVRSDEGKPSPDHEVIDGGRAVAVWAKPGKYEALVTIAIPDDKLVKFLDAEHKFIVGNSPGPIDPDVPDPPAPSDFGDVAKVISDIVAPVRDEDKAGACKIFAAAYREHGALAIKGEYKTPELLGDATSSDFVYKLGLNRYLRWRPAMSALSKHYAELNSKGVMKDMEAWGKLWQAYGEAFEKVK